MELQKTKILIVEDDGIIAEDLNSLLIEKGYSIVGVAHNGSDALDMLVTRNPDFALLDINLGSGISGLEIAKFIHEKFKLPYIFLTSFDDEQTLQQAQSFGPYGYIVKPYQERTLLTTIKTALANFKASQSSPTLVRENIDKISTKKITDQEFKIIECLINGFSYQKISESLFISVNTVKYHAKNIYLKLDINGRAELYNRVL